MPCHPKPVAHLTVPWRPCALPLSLPNRRPSGGPVFPAPGAIAPTAAPDQHAAPHNASSGSCHKQRLRQALAPLLGPLVREAGTEDRAWPRGGCVFFRRGPGPGLCQHCNMRIAARAACCLPRRPCLYLVPLAGPPGRLWASRQAAASSNACLIPRPCRWLVLVCSKLSSRRRRLLLVGGVSGGAPAAGWLASGFQPRPSGGQPRSAAVGSL
jgi:hypothetical protein